MYGQIINSKVSDLLLSLTAIERNKFEKYLNSPFFNTNASVTALFDYLNERRGNAGKVDKVQAFKKIYGTAKYEEQKINDLMSYLTKHLEDFLSILNFENQAMLRKTYLLKELRERSLHKYFEINTRDYKRRLKTPANKDQEHYYEMYLLEKELDNYFLKLGIRKNDKSLQLKSDNSDIFFLIEKLKNSCEMISRKNIIAAEYDLKMKDEVLGFLNADQTYFENVPAITIYHTILNMLSDVENETHFYKLKQELKKSSDLFSKQEGRVMYGYAQNHCIKKINAGNQEYNTHLFEIYESLLETQLIFENEYLSPSDYKNIVSIGLRLEKFDWTKTFIEKYKPKLALEFRENAYQYNLASFYYGKNDYKNALKLLQKVEFTDTFYHLGAKSMLLKMYYELDEVESFYSLVDAFKVYLIRNKNISINQRVMHQNLVKWTKRSFDIKINAGTSAGSQKVINNLKVKLKSGKNIANLQWLTERVEEL